MFFRVDTTLEQVLVGVLWLLWKKSHWTSESPDKGNTPTLLEESKNKQTFLSGVYGKLVPPNIFRSRCCFYILMKHMIIFRKQKEEKEAFEIIFVGGWMLQTSQRNILNWWGKERYIMLWGEGACLRLSDFQFPFNVDPTVNELLCVRMFRLRLWSAQ